MELPRSWGKNFDPEFQRLSTPSCPSCGKGLGDMITDYGGKPDEFLLSLVVGYTTQGPRKMYAVGIVIFECPRCLNFSWFHVEKPWALAVAEFAPKSPYFNKVRGSVRGEELEDAFLEMNVCL